jgi:hypothetical protein
MKSAKMLTILFLALGVMVWLVEFSKAESIGTAFTYQGRLMDANEAADGLYDFQFKLYDSDEPPVSNQIGSDVNKPDVDVIDGYFTVELDFGGDPNIFNGQARWLEIGFRPVGDANAHTILYPRQQVTPTPYAIYTGYAEKAGSVAGTISGGGTANYIPKFSDSDTLGDSVIYETGGNVGIGTTSPVAKLTVDGAILRSGSTMYGPNADTHINLGTSSTTGLFGQDRSYTTVGGGKQNTASGPTATVGGGWSNTASSWYTTVSGGEQNRASGYDSTVGGGLSNTASGSYATISGGEYSTASGTHSTVPGGYNNIAGGASSFAAGRRAKANHDGSFVWADSTDADFASTGNNQFLIRASGGVGIGTISPQGMLDVDGSIFQRGSELHADYVFEPGYKLESIEEHCRYMWENKHLKAIPEKRFDESGQEIVEVGAHRKGIVEELEKAHIYIAELHKRIKALETKLVRLEALLDDVQ